MDGRRIYFGRHKFYLITRFLCGKYVSVHSYRSGEMKFKSRVFPKHQGLKIIICVLENEELVLEVIFMGRLLTEQVDDKLLRLVEKLEEGNSIPWGEHIWRQLYKPDNL